MTTTVEWRKGTDRPTEDGKYIVYFIDRFDTLDFTTEHGWNTNQTNYKYPVEDYSVKAWAAINVTEELAEFITGKPILVY